MGVTWHPSPPPGPPLARHAGLGCAGLIMAGFTFITLCLALLALGLHAWAGAGIMAAASAAFGAGTLACWYQQAKLARRR